MTKNNAVCVWGHWCEYQVFGAWLSNSIPQNLVLLYNYLTVPYSLLVQTPAMHQPQQTRWEQEYQFVFMHMCIPQQSRPWVGCVLIQSNRFAAHFPPGLTPPCRLILVPFIDTLLIPLGRNQVNIGTSLISAAGFTCSLQSDPISMKGQNKQTERRISLLDRYRNTWLYREEVDNRKNVIRVDRWVWTNRI